MRKMRFFRRDSFGLIRYLRYVVGYIIRVHERYKIAGIWLYIVID